MDNLAREVAKIATNAVKSADDRGGKKLDYSEQSLATVEEILSEASAYRSELSAAAITKLSQSFGCYILEVGRRPFGGEYRWLDQRDQPVLVVGEPDFHVAMITWDKVSGRLSGDAADSIPFFYTGFADRVRAAVPGDRALYV